MLNNATYEILKNETMKFKHIIKDIMPLTGVFLYS